MTQTAQTLAAIPAEARARLTIRSDKAGLGHLGLHLGLIAVLEAAVFSGLPFWWLALWPLGIALAFLFTLQHECTHKTPFASPWLNELVGHTCGLILVQPFLWFRAFHMAHHRHTNDPDHDPELAGGNARPRTWGQMAWYLSTFGYWAAKGRVLWGNAFGPLDAPYIPARVRPRLRREARMMLAAYAVLLGLMLTAAPWLVWGWLLPLALGFPVLRLYLLAEHDRCPEVADMLRNSRTTLTNRLVRLLAWNMSFHAEHHALPNVPFHQLPNLHGHLQDRIEVLTPGYRRFGTETFAALSARD